jgi:hypothetical protein
MSQHEKVRAVKESSKEDLLAKTNVVGVGTAYKVSKGETTDVLSVAVLVRSKVPTASLSEEELIPREINGVKTDVVQVGDLRAFQNPTDRWRPAPGGVSVGHYKVTAGTFGAVVRDRASGNRLILSNNHVLANSNDAAPGDPILQPGAVDGGQLDSDVIARLERFQPIQFQVQPGSCPIADSVAGALNVVARAMGSKHRLQPFWTDQAATNTVDTAVARPISDDLIRDDILEIGTVSGVAPATLLMPVRKSGRSTGLTTGQITVLDATVTVSYGPGQTARFDGQIVSGPMSSPGDSGSLLVAGDSLQAVGLLFAGSEQSTIYNPIQAVLDALNVVI